MDSLYLQSVVLFTLVVCNQERHIERHLQRHHPPLSVTAHEFSVTFSVTLLLLRASLHMTIIDRACPKHSSTAL